MFELYHCMIRIQKYMICCLRKFRVTSKLPSPYEVSFGECTQLGAKEPAARADNKPTRSHRISYMSSLWGTVGLPLRLRALAAMLELKQ